MKRTNVFSALNEVWEERVKSDSLRHLDTSDASRFLNPNSFPDIADLLVQYSKPRVTVLSPVREPLGTAIKVIVHDGIPHADDVLAVAIVKRWARMTNNFVMVSRTRDPKKFASATFVLDVGEKREIDDNGGHYTPTLFLDHHQDDVFYDEEDVNKKHYPDGVKMAACGMIWEVLFGKSCSQRFNQYMRENLLYPIESRDNGQIPDPSAPANPLSFVRAVTSPQSCRGTCDPTIMDNMFETAVEMAENVLEGVINMAQSADDEPGNWEKFLVNNKDYLTSHETVVLDKSVGSWKKFYFRDRDAVEGLKDAKWILFPDWDGQAWCLQCLPKEEGKNDVIQPLPEGWRTQGKSIGGLIFCHKGLWLAKFKTAQDALNAVAMDCLYPHPNERYCGVE